MSEYKINPETGLYPYDTIYHKEDNGDLIKVGYRYMDPFYPDEYLIGKEPNYFTEYYGLTKAQVWNLCHGFDKDTIHVCPNCGDELYFHGFSQGAFGTFCSRSCRQSYNLKNWWKDEEYRKYTLQNSVHRADVIAQRNRTEFLNLGEESDECYFYVAWTHEYGYEWIKFGVSEMDPYYKKRRDKYSSIHILIRGERLKLADLEYELSIKLSGEWFTPDRFKEFKSYLKELLIAGNFK